MIPDSQTLTRLMVLSQVGDKIAYRALLEACGKWLTRYFARRVPPHNLEDLVQETLISIHQRRASFDPARPFLPWLAVIARNRWVDHLRRVYRQNEAGLDDNEIGFDGEPEIADRLTLDRMLELLPPGQQRAIRLVKLQGLSVSEAAGLTGQSESLIKVNIHRGIRRMAAITERE